MDQRRTTVAARFGERVAFVVGGSSGIGRAVALGFASEGASVAVVGRNEAALARTVHELEAAGRPALAVIADVTVPSQLERAVADTVQRLGRLDIAFNNAGTLIPGRVADIEVVDWERAVATNLTGVWAAMKFEIAHMRGHEGGVIVNTASTIGAHQRRVGLGSYAATKAAVSALTKTAALEYVADGIRINSISPGPVDTPMSYRAGESRVERDARVSTAVPVGRVATLDEVTDAVLWLASAESAFTVGHDLVIDGGATA